MCCICNCICICICVCVCIFFVFVFVFEFAFVFVLGFVFVFLFVSESVPIKLSFFWLSPATRGGSAASLENGTRPSQSENPATFCRTREQHISPKICPKVPNSGQLSKMENPVELNSRLQNVGIDF